ncbi:MAG TPA: LPS-assembly protein LptD [Gallionella sp.]|nr:LPS-assembly protein LptD [Gallionella sp.]
MRFRLKPVVLSLLCAFAQDAAANADLLALRMDKTFMAMKEPEQQTPSFLEADRLVGKQDDQVEATGNAVLRKRGQSISADRLLYFQNTSDLDAQGSVVVDQGGNTMSGPHLKLNLDTDIGVMEQPVFYLIENDGRGSADVMHFQDKLHYQLDNATYTTCPADNEDWLLHMSGLELDRDRQIGTAHNAWVQFMGVPILYSPWMDFPLNDQRKSGFLAPIIGSTTKGGSELTVPYYWNIAQNLDATIAPRVMAKRGVQFNNEFRYLEPGYSGELHVDVLPSDMLTKSTRTRLGVLHGQNIYGGLNGYLNLNSVSDNNYYRDLASSVNVTSQINLMQEGVLSYGAGPWNAAMRVQRYQTLQDPAAPVAVPYKRLPQLTFNAAQNYSGASVSFASEFVDFAHPTAVNGKRLVLNPAVSYPLISNQAFYLTPRAALHSTHYSMGANNAAALPNSSRTLPILSVDSGVAFERDWSLFGHDYLHTLEPRAFYVYVPYQDQSRLPVFDTAQADFNFVQMFSENRFFGSDRIGDANQITLAMTSRLLEQANGIERLKLTVGERFSFSTPQVNLVAPTATTNKSDILVAASGRVTDTWSLGSEFQIDPNKSQTQRYNFASSYRPEAGKVFNLGYRFFRNTLLGAPTLAAALGTQGELRLMDASAQWPLSGRWHAVGRWYYSLRDARVLEAIAGLEYNESCWTLRLIAQRFTVGLQQANTGFFLQLELNDFVKVGSDPLDLLKQSVPGYKKLNDKPVDNSRRALR